MSARRYPSDAEWTQGRVNTLPSKWANRLLKRWHAKHPVDPYAANVELRQSTESLLSVRIPLDATDAIICDAAATLAERCARRAEIFHRAADLRASMERICEGQGIEPPPSKKDGPAMARMCCPIWWRRKLRKHQGQTVEAVAIRLGYVGKHRNLYVSDEGLKARQQQNARNAAAMEATIARNELGQEFTIAELAASGPANKRIRRAELMTRIAGFERVAVKLDHSGLFMTITCPSRFHRFRTVNGGKVVIDNPNYDPSETPATAQTYLAAVWANIRSDLHRQGISVYGFRVAEPQHDGTPHWHLLVFCPKAHVQSLQNTVKKHALKDTPDEPGAKEHRCDFKLMDKAKGTAAGYIAKYIAKNIDGHGVGTDFNGQPAVETAVRVEAWAAKWGIRQFQQVGGPPVCVWRELRRIDALPAGAPGHLRQAHAAVNKTAVLEGRGNASVAWDHYCEAQGGVSCGRNARIKLAMLVPEQLGRYGDDPAPKPYGVETTSWEQPGLGQDGQSAAREVHWVVESTRHVWEILRQAAHAVAPRGFFAERAQPAQPWTSVNNCSANAPAQSRAAHCTDYEAEHATQKEVARGALPPFAHSCAENSTLDRLRRGFP